GCMNSTVPRSISCKRCDLRAAMLTEDMHNIAPKPLNVLLGKLPMGNIRTWSCVSHVHDRLIIFKPVKGRDPAACSGLHVTEAPRLKAPLYLHASDLPVSPLRPIATRCSVSNFNLVLTLSVLVRHFRNNRRRSPINASKTDPVTPATASH